MSNPVIHERGQDLSLLPSRMAEIEVESRRNVERLRSDALSPVRETLESFRTGEQLAIRHEARFQSLHVALADERRRADCPCCRTLIARILEAIQ